MIRKSLIITLLCLMIDQITKLLVSGFMDINSSIQIIPKFFSLSYVENNGAAWSLFSGNRIFLIIISVVALCLIYFYFIKNDNIKKLEFICYSILLGGILGNLLDRIKVGRVIDFLDFKIFGYDFPVFNLADIYIVVSIFILLIYSIKDGKKNAKASN